MRISQLSLLFLLSIGSVSYAQESIDEEYESPFDSDIEHENSEEKLDEAYEDEEYSIDDESLFAEDLDSFENENSENNNAKKSTFKLLGQLLVPAHFTYRHELAFETENAKVPVVNRSSLRLQWERGFGETYFLRFDGKTNYDAVFLRNEFEEIKDEYLNHSEIREFYIQASKGAFSLKIGRQLVVWGKADSGVITDVFSPRDITESVFTSVEDARLGQTMLVADYYFGDSETQQQLTFIANPDIRNNRFALPGHPYGPPNIDLVPSNAKEPGFSFSDTEFGFRWGYSRGKLDIALMASDLVDNNPVLNLRIDSLTPSVLLTNEFKRYQMIGGGLNWSQGRFVWKTEFAFKNDLSFNQLPKIQGQQGSTPAIEITEKDSADFALGFDFDANGHYRASLEVTNQHLLDYQQEQGMIQGRRKNESSAYAVLSKNWLNETLVTQYTSGMQLQDKDSFHRLEMTYDVNDHWSTKVQIDYFLVKESETNPTAFNALRDKHRLLFQVDYDF